MKHSVEFVLLSMMLMLCSSLSASVYSGKMGASSSDDVRWSLDTQTRTLRIMGSGSMRDCYSYAEYCDIHEGEHTEYWRERSVEYLSPWYYHVDSIEHIIIDEGITKIGENAFQECRLVKSVDLPQSLTIIYIGAFVDSGIESIYIPANVSYISSTTFTGCPLASIVVDENNPVYDSRGNCNAIILTETDCLIQGSKATIVPYGVKVIGSEAFENIAIDSINLPNSVTEIGYEAFKNSTLKSIKLPDSLLTIRSSAFSHCTELTKIDIPHTVTTIGIDAFIYCPKLEPFVLPYNLKTIGTLWGGNDILYWAAKLDTLVIPPFVEDIKIFGSLGRFFFSDHYDLYGGQPFHLMYLPIAPLPPSYDNYPKPFRNEHLVVHVLPGCKENFMKDKNWCNLNIVEDAEYDVYSEYIQDYLDNYRNLLTDITETESAQKVAQVYNLGGVKLRTSTVRNNDLKSVLAGLPRGTYIVKTKTEVVKLMNDN